MLFDCLLNLLSYDYDFMILLLRTLYRVKLIVKH